MSAAGELSDSLLPPAALDSFAYHVLSSFSFTLHGEDAGGVSRNGVCFGSAGPAAAACAGAVSELPTCR